MMSQVNLLVREILVLPNSEKNTNIYGENVNGGDDFIVIYKFSLGKGFDFCQPDIVECYSKKSIVPLINYLFNYGWTICKQKDDNFPNTHYKNNSKTVSLILIKMKTIGVIKMKAIVMTKMKTIAVFQSTQL